MALEIMENNHELTDDDIRRLWRSVGWDWYENDDGYKRTADAINDERCTTFLARDDNTLIGLAHAMDNGFIAYLCYLVVDSEHQNQGVGKALLDAFDEKFFKCHRHMMAGNEAVEFYRKNGYGHDGEYTAMAKWACELESPSTATGSWLHSAYAEFRDSSGQICRSMAGNRIQPGALGNRCLHHTQKNGVTTAPLGLAGETRKRQGPALAGSHDTICVLPS